MVTVRTKSELKSAILKKQFPIHCVGEIAEQLKKKKKRSKKALVGGAAMAVAGLAAIPFTGGASAAATATGISAMGLTATALTVGTVAISAGELAILVGGATTVAIVAILKGRKITVGSDGSVTIG